MHLAARSMGIQEMSFWPGREEGRRRRWREDLMSYRVFLKC